MSNRKFVQPTVFTPGYGLNGLNPGGDDDDTGIGSAQTSPDIRPVSFADWQTMFAVDMDSDGDEDEDDFYLWWVDKKFSPDDWTRLNPTLPWPGNQP